MLIFQGVWFDFGFWNWFFEFAQVVITDDVYEMGVLKRMIEL